MDKNHALSILVALEFIKDDIRSRGLSPLEVETKLRPFIQAIDHVCDHLETINSLTE